MKRLLGVLLVGVGLALVPGGANAAVAVSITASDTSIAAGQVVTFRGSASGKSSGRKVELQRKRSGRWATAQSQILSSRRTYTFTVAPPKGKQVYRVVLPPSAGHPGAVSSEVTIAVQWTPKVVLDPVTPVHDGTGTQYLDITGESNAVGASIRLQRQIRDVWMRWGAADVKADGSFSVELPNVPKGTPVRAVLPAAGPRLAAYSAIQATDLAPFTLTLGGPPLTMRGVAGSPYDAVRVGAVVHFDARAGDLVSFDGLGPAVSPYPSTLLGPDGHEVPARLVQGQGGFSQPYYPIEVDGTYSLLITQEYDGPRTVRGQTQAVLTTTVDGPAQSVSSEQVGQVVTLEFDGVAGQVVGAAIDLVPGGSSCARFELLRGGQIVPPAMSRLWDLKTDGRYDLAFIPCDDDKVVVPSVRIVGAARSTAVLNEQPATATLDEAGEAAVFSFHATAGDQVGLYTSFDGGRDLTPSRIVDPAGDEIPAWDSRDFTATESGTYEVWYDAGHSPPYLGSITLWASTPLEVDTALDAAPTTLPDAVGRRLDFHFDGLADQYVTLFEDEPHPSCDTYLELFDDTGRLYTYVGPQDAMRLPHDGSFDARVYPCAQSGSIGLVSSAPTTIEPGQSAHLELVHPSGAVIAVIPAPADGAPVDVTVSGIELGGARFRAGLYQSGGGQIVQQPATSSTDAFTLRNSATEHGTVLYIRSEDPFVTGSVDVSVTQTGP